MFARFRNLFSKNKTEPEGPTNTSFGSSVDSTNTSTNVTGSTEKSSQLEGLNLIKSIVENEHQSQANSKVKKTESVPPSSLSEEVAELLSKRILKNKEIEENKKEMILCKSIRNETHDEIRNRNEVSQHIEQPTAYENPSKEKTNELVSTLTAKDLKSSDNKNSDSKTLRTDKIGTISEMTGIENISEINPSDELLHQKQVPTDATKSEKLDSIPVEDIADPSNIKNSREKSSKFSDHSKSLSQSLVKENHGHSATQSSLENLEINLCNNSSIVVEDLPSEITIPSPTVESTISGSSSSTSTLESCTISVAQDPSKIIVNPINNNALACNAITNKLSDIAEVAESLDAVIRDVQENVQTVEIDSKNPTQSHKKLDTLRSTSSEDWHSRSTEDDSFVTASEGNFTPSSSSFQTASGRTCSYISCDKNSFDASEADDSTYALEMPELTSPLNISFEGSEQSYLSAQPLNVDLIAQDKRKTSTKTKENVCKSSYPVQEDQSSIADIEELHSENVTPTPEESYEGYVVDSIPVESETELDVAGIADAPSMAILTEHTTMPMSRTPEVSPSTSNACSNQNPITTQMTVNMATDSNVQHEQQNATNNNNKPNAAWRRSKYYENITKQTIKGFL